MATMIAVKSEIRNTKLETNLKYKILRHNSSDGSVLRRTNFKGVNSCLRFVVWYLGFVSCLGFRISSFPLYAAQDTGQAQLFYQQGMRALQENDVAQAEEDLKQATTLDPSNFQYHFELSNVYAARYDQSQKGKGETFFARESLSASLSQLEQTVMLKPDYIPGHFNLGVIYKNQSQYERAREHLKKVITLNPQEIRAYLQIGETYERQGFFDEARDVYRQAKEINAADASIQDAIETSYLNEKQYEQARKSKGHSDYLSRASQLIRPGALAGDTSQNAQDQNGTPSLASLGMMLAQQVMSKKSAE
ncbi:MAG: tetratricopeptide repeat protein [Candidatus Omnitrophica bacterium]|nr:tetratricopeptide repeat protein [Candidatus Omnitrophota bacterium]